MSSQVQFTATANTDRSGRRQSRMNCQVVRKRCTNWPKRRFETYRSMSASELARLIWKSHNLHDQNKLISLSSPPTDTQASSTYCSEAWRRMLSVSLRALVWWLKSRNANLAEIRKV